jgi:tRNA modification GTPase
MNLPNLTDTIVALATPPGLGAIAVIRLSGPYAIEVADLIFKGKKLSGQPSHTAHFGHIHDLKGRDIDEVLATVFHGDKSYTGQPPGWQNPANTPCVLSSTANLISARPKP